jgi:CMP/dCMP kinase
MTNSSLTVTIDGPAGSGKSTVSRMLAKRIGAVFLDTGAMYRAVTLAAMNKGVDLADQSALLDVLKGTDFGFSVADDTMIVLVDGVDATETIRTPTVTENAKYIACAPNIRTELVEMQRLFAKQNSRVVTEGRDQGTVAFPDADYKFFLVADITERAKRRKRELADKNVDVELDALTKQIADRDASDINRSDGPLIKADDAIEIDTTNINANGVVNKMLEYIK